MAEPVEPPLLPPERRPSTAARWVPWIAAALVTAWLAVTFAADFRPTAAAGEFDRDALGKLPVSYGGRFKPLDTVARNGLTILSGKQTLEVGEAQWTAMHWLTDVLSTPQRAADYKVFRVDNPEVRALAGIADAEGKRFSYAQMQPKLAELFNAARQADQTERGRRTAFQNEALELAGHITVFLGFANHESIHNIPTEGSGGDMTGTGQARLPGFGADWAPMHGGDPAASGIEGETAHAVRLLYVQAFQAYAQNDPATFNDKVAQLRAQLTDHAPVLSKRANIEWHFNHYAPFSKAMTLYVLAGLLIVFSWLFWPSALLGAAFKIVVITVVLHTIALGVRVYLSGRPPVTNLYSSAVFIGWGVVLLSLLLEPMLKRGLGLIVGVGVGFATLLIAQGLSADGDTMAVLQAVLDTNFWLATHVIVITFGYTAAYVAGALGIVFVLAGLFTKAIDRPLARRLAAAIYGTTCFAILLSFIGTILGGIWADQSWGRFWGWDPKENGALMIVIWCAVVLHCRWGHMVKERGLALLAILGNIVVSWSWFGTNLLGAGLHSYGFTEAGSGSIWQKLLNPGPKEWLLIFVFSQLLVVALGLLPMRVWRSFRRPVKRSAGKSDQVSKSPRGKTAPA
jgi:ABC-type transport system involved in cytochrome c biogenesis permease subunit